MAPQNKLSAAECAGILSALNSPGFVDLAPMQVYTKLLDQEIYLGAVLLGRVFSPSVLLQKAPCVLQVANGETAVCPAGGRHHPNSSDCLAPTAVRPVASKNRYVPKSLTGFSR